MKSPTRIKLLCSALYIAIALGGTVSADQMLHLEMQSEPGDFIGQGQNWDVLYLDTNTAFFFAQLETRGGSTLPNYLTFNVMQLPVSTHYLLAQFGTDQLGHELQPGTYLDAMRAPFADPGHPGLDISFEHRGCNTLTGEFTIHDIQYHQSGDGWVLDYFDVSFVQHCEGLSPALTGRIVYSTSSIPEPASATISGFILLLFALRSRPKR